MALKSATSEEVTNTNMNTNPNHGSGGPGEEEEPEEGEIVGGDGESKQSTTAVVHQPHPLEHSWTFWFDNPSAKSKGSAWGSSIRPIYTFSTGEEFWGGGNEGVPMDPSYDDMQVDGWHKEFQWILGDGRNIYNNIPHPSKLTLGADFHCFKHKIEPKWEDPVCANGGKWTATFNKGRSDTCWLYTLLAMIGEQFDHGDEICGAVVNVRARQEKIALWTKNARNEAALAASISYEILQMSIGKQWKEFLDYNETIGFMFHEDAKRLVRAAKNRYTI